MALWYIFTRTAGANPNDPTNYTPGQASQPACPGSGNLCAILAEDNGFGYPTITVTLQNAIALALSTGTDQSNVILRSI